MDVMIICILLLVFVVCIAMLRYVKIHEIYGGRRREKIKDLSVNPRTKSEEYAVKTLEDITRLKFPTVLPSWLRDPKSKRQLELDGYSAEAKLAIEFSGPLHTKWFPNKEPYSKYIERVERDELKLSLCKQNGVSLIVIDSTLPKQHMRAYLKSRLYDIGWLKEKPHDYIDEQKIEPYR